MLRRPAQIGLGVLFCVSVVCLFGTSLIGRFCEWRAKAAFSRWDAHDAEIWLKRQRTWGRDDADVEFLLARAKRKQGDLSGMRAHLIAARRLGAPAARLEREQWLGLAQEGQLSEVEGHMRELLTDPRGDAAEICEAFVAGFSRLNRIDSAGHLIEAWIADYPADPRPHRALGKLQSNSQQWVKAVASFRKALELAPHYTSVRGELGDALLAHHQTAEALTEYELCCKDPKTWSWGMLGRVRCLRTQQKPGLARELLEELLRKEPAISNATVQLAEMELEDDRPDRALELLQSISAETRPELSTRFALARALQRVGRTEEARRHFHFVESGGAALSKIQVLTRKVWENPEDVESRYEIGMLHIKYDNPAMGVVWLQSVLNYSPSHRNTHAALAEYYEVRAAQDVEWRELARKHALAAARSS